MRCRQRRFRIRIAAGSGTEHHPLKQHTRILMPFSGRELNLWQKGHLLFWSRQLIAIVVVKKTFRYTNVFLLQPLMPPFLISEHKCETRYKLRLDEHFNDSCHEINHVYILHLVTCGNRAKRKPSSLIQSLTSIKKSHDLTID